MKKVSCVFILSLLSIPFEFAISMNKVSKDYTGVDDPYIADWNLIDPLVVENLDKSVSRRVLKAMIQYAFMYPKNCHNNFYSIQTWITFSSGLLYNSRIAFMKYIKSIQGGSLEEKVNEYISKLDIEYAEFANKLKPNKPSRDFYYYRCENTRNINIDFYVALKFFDDLISKTIASDSKLLNIHGKDLFSALMVQARDFLDNETIKEVESLLS